MKKAIIGSGSFAREIRACILDEVVYFVEDQFYSQGYKDCHPLSEFKPDIYEVVVAVADTNVRKRIVESLPKDTQYFTYIHNTAQILDNNIDIGEGSIICANCIITTNVVIGKHCHLNLATTVGHDTIIGNYFTSSPGVHISGNCEISNLVTMGTGSAIKEKTKILCENVTIGMQAAVVKDISEPGVYVGVPCNKMKK